MRSISCLSGFLWIKCSNAFLKSQQRFINLSSFLLPILIIGLTVLSSFRSCQIDQQKFTRILHTFLMYLDLANSMTTTWSIICFGGMCCSSRISELNQLENLFFRLDKLFFEALDLNLLTLIFQDFKLLVIVNKIVDLSSIDFVHRNCHCEVSLLLLEVINTSIEKILNC